eukprot:1161223-Pelagomonas_calceolata.AAC.2
MPYAICHMPAMLALHDTPVMHVTYLQALPSSCSPSYLVAAPYGMPGTSSGASRLDPVWGWPHLASAIFLAHDTSGSKRAPAHAQTHTHVTYHD